MRISWTPRHHTVLTEIHPHGGVGRSFEYPELPTDLIEQLKEIWNRVFSPENYPFIYRAALDLNSPPLLVGKSQAFANIRGHDGEPLTIHRDSFAVRLVEIERLESFDDYPFFLYLFAQALLFIRAWRENEPSIRNIFPGPGFSLPSSLLFGARDGMPISYLVENGKGQQIPVTLIIKGDGDRVLRNLHEGQHEAFKSGIDPQFIDGGDLSRVEVDNIRDRAVPLWGQFSDVEPMNQTDITPSVQLDDHGTVFLQLNFPNGLEVKGVTVKFEERRAKFYSEDHYYLYDLSLNDLSGSLGYRCPDLDGTYSIQKSSLTLGLVQDPVLDEQLLSQRVRISEAPFEKDEPVVEAAASSSKTLPEKIAGSMQSQITSRRSKLGGINELVLQFPKSIDHEKVVVRFDDSHQSFQIFDQDETLLYVADEKDLGDEATFTGNYQVQGRRLVLEIEFQKAT